MAQDRDTTDTEPSRRDVVTAAPRMALAAGLASLGAGQSRAASPHFPKGFLWGAATAGHQIEGANVNSDMWVLEHVQPTFFAESSGDACDSFNRWAEDLDLVRAIGLNSYRFSLEWARIEPAEGEFSEAMLDHYARIIDGCAARGLKSLVTFNHYACPRWFAAKGLWTAPDAADRFARFCERAARRLAGSIDYATTLNEPNIPDLLKYAPLPPQFGQIIAATMTAAARSVGSDRFANAIMGPIEMEPQLLAAHEKGFTAIKSARPNLPVGVSLAMEDDQAAGTDTSVRDAKRRDAYGAWFEAVKRHGDFIGVQNYTRRVYDGTGLVKPPAGAIITDGDVEFYPASLGATIRLAHAGTGKPVLVTENGIATTDDTLRVRYIPEAIRGMKQTIDDGIPVIGYQHWSLLDNFEWMLGYRLRYGLVAVDRKTFVRTPKPSAAILGAIAKRNGLG